MNTTTQAPVTASDRGRFSAVRFLLGLIVAGVAAAVVAGWVGVLVM